MTTTIRPAADADWPHLLAMLKPVFAAGDTYAVHYFRYVFGFNLDGDIVWAYQNPRVELEEHFYEPDHTNLLDLGYQPTHDVEAEIVTAFPLGVSEAEWYAMTGLLVARMGMGLLKPKNTILGADIAGRVEVVPQEFGRVILNLIGNAFDAVREKGEYLKAELEGLVKKHPKVYVEQRGMGFLQGIQCTPAVPAGSHAASPARACASRATGSPPRVRSA